MYFDIMNYKQIIASYIYILRNITIYFILNETKMSKRERLVIKT